MSFQQLTINKCWCYKLL